MKGAMLVLVVAIVAGMGLYFHTRVVDDVSWEHTLTIDGSAILLKRNPTNGGMIEIWGKDHLDYARSLGSHLLLSLLSSRTCVIMMEALRVFCSQQIWLGVFLQLRLSHDV